MVKTIIVNMNEKEILQEILKCQKSFKYFCKNYAKIYHPIKGLINFNLYEYQEKKVIPAIEKNRFSIFRKFRQSGLSTTVSIYALWKSMFDVDFKTLIVSKSDREAMNLMEMMKTVWKNLPDWIRCEAEQFNRHAIKLETGSEISCYTPKAGRSFAISLLIVDEAAFIDNMENIWKATFPVLSTGGKAIIVSTVNGYGNWYYKCWHDAINEENQFEAIRLSYKEHPEYNNPEWEETMKKQLGPQGWAQEVLGEFIGSDNTFILPDTLKKINKNTKEPIQKIFDDKLWIWKNPQKNINYIITIDVAEGLGENYDNSAFHVININTLEQVAEYYCNDIQTSDFTKIIYEIGKLYNDALIVSEIVGNTLSLAILERLYNELDYDNIYWSKTSRKKMKMGFIINNKIRPLVLEKLSNCLHNELCTINSERTSNELNSFIYNSKSNKPEARKGAHDDLVMSLAIGLYVRDKIDYAMPIINVESENLNNNKKRTFSYENEKNKEIQKIKTEINNEEIQKIKTETTNEQQEIEKNKNNYNEENININAFIQTQGDKEEEEEILKEFGWL